MFMQNSNFNTYTEGHKDGVLNGPEPSLADDVLASVPDVRNKKAKRRDSFVLVGALRGFSRINNDHTTGEIIRFASEYLYRMTEIAQLHGATVRRLTGDSFMAIFEGSGIAHGAQNQAVIAALEMQDRLNALNQNRDLHGNFTLGMGIGISTGMLITGNTFSNRRMEYAVLGDTVQIAGFLQSLAETGKIIATSDVIEKIGQHFRSVRMKPVPFRCQHLCLEISEIVGS